MFQVSWCFENGGKPQDDDEWYCRPIVIIIPENLVLCIKNSSHRARASAESPTVWRNTFSERDWVCAVWRIGFFTKHSLLKSVSPKNMVLIPHLRSLPLQDFHLFPMKKMQFKGHFLTLLSRNRVNHKKSSICVWKMISKPNSRSGRNTSTGVLLCKMTISKIQC